MKNLFSLTTQQFEQDYQSYLANPRSVESQSAINNLIFIVPLAYPFNDTNSLLKIRAQLEELVQSLPLDELANLCIELCTPYLFSEMDITANMAYETEKENTVLQKLGCLITSDRVSGYNSAKYLKPHIQDYSLDFIQEILQHRDAMLQDIMDFLLLSYGYTLSLSKRNSTVLYDIVKAFTLKHDDSPQADFSTEADLDGSDPASQQTMKINSKTNMTKGYFKTVTGSDHPYLFDLFDYSKPSDKANSKPRVQWRSLYDVPIMLGLVSAYKKHNPFLHIKFDPTHKVNLTKFLSNFDLFKHFPNMNNDIGLVSEVIRRFHKTEDKQSTKLLEDKFWSYYNYSLERVTNINLINKCYAIAATTESPTAPLDSITPLASYPLLKFRLTLLELYTNKWFKAPEWQRGALALALQNIIQHQIYCTLPLMNIVFHMLVLLKKGLNADTKTNTESYKTDGNILTAAIPGNLVKQKRRQKKKTYSIDPDLDQHFTEIRKHLDFFTFSYLDKKTILDPTYSFPSNSVGNTNYSKIYHSIYKNFLTNMEFSRNHEFFESANSVKQTMFSPSGFSKSIKNKYDSYDNSFRGYIKAHED